VKITITVLMFLCLALFLAGSVWADADEPEMTESAMVDLEAAKVTFEATCAKCHALSRPLGKKKDAEGWQRTVKRMAGYHKSRLGSEIPEEDQNAIIQYLLENAGK
jgi:hypothetical protein